MTPSPSFWPQGTVYGTLLNSRAELLAWATQASQAPYKAPPRAPVLYIKTANTWSQNGSRIDVPAHVPEVEIGASVAMVIGAPQFGTHGGPATPGVAGFVLVNDLCVPHTSFFRPPVKTKCLDGFLGLGPTCVSPHDAGDPGRFILEVRIDDALRQTVDFSDAVRDASTLLSDVSAFMTLRPGDLLMLGCGAGRPLATAGQRIDIRAAGRPAFGVLSNTLAAQLAEAA